MARKRDGFVPLGDVVAGVDLPGVPVLTRRERAPQARRHFTQLDQVTQLVAASEADADLGFMARMLALCSLPRANLGDQLQYVRRNGPLTLAMTAGVNNKLPYGNLSRACSWRGSAPKLCGRSAASSSSAIRSRRSCGVSVSTTAAARCVVGSKSRCGGYSILTSSWSMSTSTAK